MASLTSCAYASGNNLRSRQDLDRTTEHKEDGETKDRRVVKGSVVLEDMLLKEEEDNVVGGNPRLLWEEGMPSSFDRTQEMEEDFDFRYYTERADEKDIPPESLKLGLLREESNRNYFPEERYDYAPPEDKRSGFLAEEDGIMAIPAERPETRSYVYTFNFTVYFKTDDYPEESRITLMSEYTKRMIWDFENFKPRTKYTFTTQLQCGIAINFHISDSRADGLEPGGYVIVMVDGKADYIGSKYKWGWSKTYVGTGAKLCCSPK